jgi:hypothetical protein
MSLWHRLPVFERKHASKCRRPSKTPIAQSPCGCKSVICKGPLSGVFPLKVRGPLPTPPFGAYPGLVSYWHADGTTLADGARIKRHL